MPPVPAEASENRLTDDCRRCPALVESRSCIAWGNGPLDATLVVVGEAPGAGDRAADRWRGGNHTGLAYTSAHSGRRLRSMLEQVGYGPDACYFTNAVKCFPGDGDGGSREPTASEKSNCRPYLERELRSVDPAVTLTTGNHATESVLAIDDEGVDGFLDCVLEPQPLSRVDTTLLPILHPSYQDVWIPRIGYTPERYREAIGAAIDHLVAAESDR